MPNLENLNFHLNSGKLISIETFSIASLLFIDNFSTLNWLQYLYIFTFSFPSYHLLMIKFYQKKCSFSFQQNYQQWKIIFSLKLFLLFSLFNIFTHIDVQFVWKHIDIHIFLGKLKVKKRRKNVYSNWFLVQY